MTSNRPIVQASTEYFLHECLGEGMSSQVFRAERSLSRLGLRQTVAIKILKSKNAVEMWRQEFESLARVTSPFCVQVFAFEEIQGQPALVLEFINGLNLRELLQYGRLSAEDCREILAQVHAGLNDLHQVGLSHGDLSPKNIMVDTRGQVRLLDFGLANCHTDQTFFTPGFAAPELLAGGAPNPQTDLYSLGAVATFLEKCSQSPLRGQRDQVNTGRAQPLWPLELNCQRKEKLAEKVSTAMEMRKVLSNFKTRTLPQRAAPSQPPLRKFQLLLVAAMFVFTSDSSQSSTTRRTDSRGGEAVLRIRTLNWHYIYIDGRPAGYAPVDLQHLAAGPHEITWRNAQSSGRLQIQLSEKETKTLSERDLHSY